MSSKELRAEFEKFLSYERYGILGLSAFVDLHDLDTLTLMYVNDALTPELYREYASELYMIIFMPSVNIA